MNTSDNKKSELSLLIDRVPEVIKGLVLPVAIIIGFLLITYIISIRTNIKWVDFLNQAGVFVTLATAALAFSTWLNVQRMRSAKPPLPGKAGDNAAILVIDIGKKNILGNVQMSCSSNDKLKGLLSGTGFSNTKSILDLNSQIKSYGYQVNVPNESRIISLTGDYAPDNEEIAQDVYRAFSWIDRALHENGISVLHVFYSGPVIVPFFLGELFSNSFAIYIYKYVRRRTKENSTKPAISENEESEENIDNPGSYYYCGMMDHIQYMDRK